MVIRLLLCMLVWCTCLPLPAQTVVVPRANLPTDRRDDYPREVLALALKHVPKPYRLEASPTFMMQGRAIIELQHGRNLDVLWTMTTAEREKVLLPVRIPVDRGLLGWRLLLVREQALPQFAKLTLPGDLQQLKGAQEFDWPDVTVLKQAGFDVHEASFYERIFAQLSAGRVDYFPRSVQEIWGELKAHPGLGLAVEPTIALHYPSATYFFVNRDNTALAEDIRQGMLAAIADGSFEALFQRHFGAILQQARLSERRVLELENPLLPAQTPVKDQRLWYRPRK